VLPYIADKGGEGEANRGGALPLPSQRFLETASVPLFGPCIKFNKMADFVLEKDRPKSSGQTLESSANRGRRIDPFYG
jgi:hypothetical protein